MGYHRYAAGPTLARVGTQGSDEVTVCPQCGDIVADDERHFDCETVCGDDRMVMERGVYLAAKAAYDADMRRLRD